MRDEVNSDTGQDTVIDAPLHVLGYTDEDGLWWAHALEVDLLGHGDSFAEALQCLKGVLQVHFEYVHVKNMEDSLPHRAEAKYWRMFYNASKPRIMMQGEKNQRACHIMRWLFRNPPLTPTRKLYLNPTLISFF